MPRLKLGTAFGIGIYLHWSFLLLPLLVFWTTSSGGDLTQGLFSVTLVLVLFGCVVLHELGHALMARHFGIDTRDITLYPIGGVARLERMSEQPWEEFFIALAGPAVNVVIAAVLLIIALPTLLVVGSGPLQGTWWGQFVVQLFVYNLFLVGFNMIPAFPMDGGRILRSLLALNLSHLRATEVAVGIGGVLAMLMIGAGIGLPLLLVSAGVATSVFQGPWMLSVVGLFVLFVGQQELFGVRKRAAAREQDYELLEVLSDQQPPVLPQPPEDDPGFSGIAWNARRRAWVVWQNGRPVSTYGARPE